MSWEFYTGNRKCRWRARVYPERETQVVLPQQSPAKKQLEAGSKREKKGGEERRNVIISVWQFGTGNRKCRWHARIHPERENKVILPFRPLELRHRAKQAGCGRLRSRSICFGHVLAAVLQGQHGPPRRVQRRHIRWIAFLKFLKFEAGR